MPRILPVPLTTTLPENNDWPSTVTEPILVNVSDPVAAIVTNALFGDVTPLCVATRAIVPALLRKSAPDPNALKLEVYQVAPRLLLNVAFATLMVPTISPLLLIVI